MKLVKIIDTERKFKDKNGNEHVSTQYKIILENGNAIFIKPVFANDYRALDIVSEVFYRSPKDESNKK